MKLVIIGFLLLLMPKAPTLAQSTTQTSPAAQKDKKNEEKPRRVYWDEGLWVRVWSEKLRLKIGGQAQIDTTDFAVRDPEPVELEGGVEWRRARLYTLAAIQKNWLFKFQWDFTGEAALKDAWFQYTLPLWRRTVALRGGRFTTVFGLENDGSSNDLLFLEQGLTSVFVPPQETGVLLHSESSRLRWDISFSSGQSDLKKCLICNVVGVTGRFSTGFELGRQDRLLHLGGDYSRRWPGKEVNFLVWPESHYAPFFLESDPIQADRVDTGLIEAAFLQGPFSMQSEIAIAGVKPQGISTQVSNAFYVSGSYAITGEMRGYSKGSGMISRIRPNRAFSAGSGGLGALEVALLYSHIHLSGDSTTANSLDDISFGFNWYPTYSTRASFNIIRADKPTWQPVWIFAMRIQLAY